MGELTIRHRAGVRRARAGLAARVWTSRLLASPMLRWRYGSTVAERMLVQPHDPRPVDPAVAAEIAAGVLRVRSGLIEVGGERPFDQPALASAARDELEGFGWLRHLKGIGTAPAQASARRLMRAWARHGSTNGAVEVTARRVMSWLSVAEFVAAGQSDDIHDVVLDTIAVERIRLAAHLGAAPPGPARLAVLVALAVTDMVIEGRDAQAERSFDRLLAELPACTSPAGGPLSRSAADTLDLIHDLTMVRMTRLTLGLPVDPRLAEAIARAATSIAHVRLGDGTTARFHGGALAADEVYALAPPRTLNASETGVHIRDGFARLERAGTIVIMDVAPPPQLALGADATASCLALEVSVGDRRLIGSVTPVGGASETAAVGARATLAHATLTLAGRSSGALVEIRAPAGGTAACRAVRGPDQVRVESSAAAGDVADQGAVVAAAHSGYVASHGLEHRRRIELAADGQSITGMDGLAAPTATIRLRTDIPFAIHFHIEPGVDATLDPVGQTVDLRPRERLRPAVHWRFSCGAGARLALEVGPGGGGRQLAIVLRGATFGESEIQWRLEAFDITLKDESA